MSPDPSPLPPRRRVGRWLALTGLAAAAATCAALGSRPGRVGPAPPAATPGLASAPRIGEPRGEPPRSAARGGEDRPSPSPAARPRVVVRVVDDRGRPDPAGWAEPVECPGWRPAPGGSPEGLAYEAEPGRCSVRAARADGLARTEGPSVELWLAEGAEQEVELTIPWTRTGGIQLAFRDDPEGVRVQWVPPGSDLARAGVGAGDLLISVDGRPLSGLDPQEVRSALTGPEGGTTVLTLRSDGDTGRAESAVVLTHALVEPAAEAE